MTKSQQTIYQSSLISLCLSLSLNVNLYNHSPNLMSKLLTKKERTNTEHFKIPPCARPSSDLLSLSLIGSIFNNHEYTSSSCLLRNPSNNPLLPELFSSLFWVLMAAIQFIGKDSYDFLPPYFRFFNKINLMAII